MSHHEHGVASLEHHGAVIRLSVPEPSLGALVLVTACFSYCVDDHMTCDAKSPSGLYPRPLFDIVAVRLFATGVGSS